MTTNRNDKQLLCPLCGVEMDRPGDDGAWECLRCGGCWLPGDDTADPFAGWLGCYKSDVKRRPAKRGGAGGGGKRKKIDKPLPTDRWRLN